MEPSDQHETFGERFLAALRAEMGASLFDYAQAQKIKAMGRDEVVKALRERGGADYATIQRAKQCDEPEELARMLADRVRAAQQQFQSAMIISSMLWC